MDYKLNDYNTECTKCLCYACPGNGDDCYNCKKCSGNNASGNAKIQNDYLRLKCGNYKK